MKRLFTSIPVALSIAILPFGISFWLSMRTHNWSWVVRSGAFLMIGGSLLIVRRLIRLGIRGIVNETWMQNGGSFQPRSFWAHAESQEQRFDRISLAGGIILVVAGLLLWAYGDFIYLI